MGQNIKKRTMHNNLLHINPYCSYVVNILYTFSTLKIDGETIFTCLQLNNGLQFYAVICDEYPF